MGAKTASSSGAAPARGVVLAAGSITGMGCGAIYMWSIFNKPLMEMFGFTTSEVSMAYSLFLLASCVSGWLAGWLQRHMQSRFIVVGAGVVFGLGWLLTGFANNLAELYLFFGCLAGTGNGLLYNTILAVVMKWFPDKRGFANGVCVGVLGLGPLLFAPAGNGLIEAFDVQTAFRIVGIVWLVVYLTLSWLLRTPPAGWQPAGWQPNAAATDDAPAETSAEASAGTSRTDTDTTSAAHREVNLTSREMVRRPLFYVLFLLFMVATASGLMVTGHASNIGQEMAGLTPAEGAILVGSMAVGNFIGRFGFGFVSDFLGRYNTMVIVLALNAAVMLLFLGNAHSFVEFLLAVSLVGACFGATMTIMPAIVGDAFGSENFGQNYSFVYPGYTVAAFVGPMLAASMMEAAGTYAPAFIVAGIISLVGIVLVLIGRVLAARQ